MHLLLLVTIGYSSDSLRQDEPCPNQLSRIVERPWGVADLKLFSDDACDPKNMEKGGTG